MVDRTPKAVDRKMKLIDRVAHLVDRIVKLVDRTTCSPDIESENPGTGRGFKI
ncbi:hypothetical protein ACQCVP_18380 [Rossellomorea vietnamensis]|uniref:hypothetical protein n=1 Tax=Rossellomorea vietnamensis TaxID=218284 RepID=UPI003CEC4D8A